MTKKDTKMNGRNSDDLSLSKSEQVLGELLAERFPGVPVEDIPDELYKEAEREAEKIAPSRAENIPKL